MNVKLVPVKDVEALKAVGCFLKKSTLYDYHHKRKHQDWFVKIGTGLYLRVDSWNEYLRNELINSNDLSESEIDEIIGRMEGLND